MFIDAHTHHHLSNYSTLELIRGEGYEASVVLAYIPLRPSGPGTLVDLFNWLLDVEPERHKALGLKVYVGVGVHPRNIPLTGLEEVLNNMEDYLSRADVLGEVGLETSSDEECEVLLKLLKIADRLDKAAIIHTPRKAKDVAVKKLPKILMESGINLRRVVVDHASLDLIEEFLRLGTYIGLTVQPGKLADVHVRDIVVKYPEVVDVGVLNSDCGRDPSDPLAVKKTYSLLINEGVGKVDANKLARDNFLRLIKH